ncbi:protein of unknown function [Rhodovastum atsumiense]|nr:protein of unknown function [Rhodovastum atsumiense]
MTCESPACVKGRCARRWRDPRAWTVRCPAHRRKRASVCPAGIRNFPSSGPVPCCRPARRTRQVVPLDLPGEPGSLGFPARPELARRLLRGAAGEGTSCITRQRTLQCLLSPAHRFLPPLPVEVRKPPPRRPQAPRRSRCRWPRLSSPPRARPGFRRHGA